MIVSRIQKSTSAQYTQPYHLDLGLFKLPVELCCPSLDPQVPARLPQWSSAIPMSTWRRRTQFFNPPWWPCFCWVKTDVSHDDVQQNSMNFCSDAVMSTLLKLKMIKFHRFSGKAGQVFRDLRRKHDCGKPSVNLKGNLSEKKIGKAKSWRTWFMSKLCVSPVSKQVPPCSPALWVAGHPKSFLPNHQ